MSTVIDPPTDRRPVEVLYESEHTRVSRLPPADSGKSLIRKERIGPGSLDRTRRELRILNRLAGVSGVPRLANSRGSDELLFDDSHGVTLAELIDEQTPGIDECVEWSIELAGIVGAVHRAGVVHWDLNPSNILVSGPDRRAALIDFDLASTFGQERPGFADSREIVGTLPYLAPEQTGRTGMAVDERADLYGLGATFYQLTTGEPPFPIGDPMRMVRDTLAKVPVPPADRDTRIPRQFSDIVMRLLEKEPDRRYQSADGLAHDLTRMRNEISRGVATPFPLGERDFPHRLSAPSRLIGRAAEVGALKAAFDDAMRGGGRGVLVAGAPGVGKTALVGELRSVVTAAEGWFVIGKFDQHRQDFESAGFVQALRALGRLLLAGSESELIDVRARIESALGSNLHLIAGMPEFAALLQIERAANPSPAAGDARALSVRQHQAVLDLLRAVASPQRPVVIAIDDLQWAGAVSVSFLDVVLTDSQLTGVLLVASYRDAEVSLTHPLAAALARWERLGFAPTTLRLANLPAADVGELLAEMLRLPSEEAADLAAAIGARSSGNPFDTIELVDALRRHGALVPSAAGWSWDAAEIRRFIGKGDVVDLLAARIGLMPGDSRELLDVMACLGGDVDLGSLSVATGVNDIVMLGQRLIPPLEDGLLVLDRVEPPTVRFPHDRVRQAAYRRLETGRRREIHLTIARRLAAEPASRAMAAEQYLQAIDLLDDPEVADPGEFRAAAELFVAAASTMRVLNPGIAERFLVAAVNLLRGIPPLADDPLLGRAERQLHAVLYGLGRLAEADALFAAVERRTQDPIDLVEPVCFQLLSLTNRGRPREAVERGMALLRRLGIQVPANDFGAGAAHRHDEMLAWALTLNVDADLAIPESRTPEVRAAEILLTALTAPSYFCEPSITAWLFATSRQLWAEHGPSAPLVAFFGGATTTTIMLWQDYATGYAIARHVLAVGTRRGYEPETSYGRYVFTLTARVWFEPLQDLARHCQNAREGLVRLGDLQMACFTYFIAITALLDCSPTLDSAADEVESAMTFASRTGNDYSTSILLPHRQLLRALRGQTAEEGTFNDVDFDEAVHLQAIALNPSATAQFHVLRALAAAVFNDSQDLIDHAAAAMPLLPYIVGIYAAVLAHLVQGLALAQRARAAGPAERPALIAELESCRDWMVERAADAPGNFGHLATLLTAEHAWATGDPERAARTFDAARRELTIRQRPWHQALITERSALFHLDGGFEQTGRDLLEAAKRHYLAWSATGKVRQLDEEYPFLRVTALRRPSENASRQPSLAGGGRSGDDLDLLAILRASQALSSETSLDRLRTRLGELLKDITGATTVLLALRGRHSDEWLVWNTAEVTAPAVPLSQVAAADLLPMSAFRYAERTREPLLVYDATLDDRFARDPYLRGLERCSLLVVPLLSQGVLGAILVLENRSRKGAFAVDGLDGVMLITGQLIVSLDNARLYASLERKVAERTDALEVANRKLESLSNTDALTQLANRRLFDTTLDAELRRAVRQGTPLGLAMIDVDQFKSYNDHYGHVAGDKCLRNVAKALRSGVRSTPDLVCRYGGEEFAAILPGADEAISLRVAERIRAAVEAQREPHAGRTDQDAGNGRVTVSIGVATMMPGDVSSGVDLVAAADLALYEAKSGGRNQVRPLETHRRPRA